MAFNSQYLPILEHDIADDEEPLEDIHVASVVIPDIEEQDEREYYYMYNVHLRKFSDETIFTWCT